MRTTSDPIRGVPHGIPLRNETSADLLFSSNGHLGAADVRLGLRGLQAPLVRLREVDDFLHLFARPCLDGTVTGCVLPEKALTLARHR